MLSPTSEYIYIYNQVTPHHKIPAYVVYTKTI